MKKTLFSLYFIFTFFLLNSCKKNSEEREILPPKLEFLEAQHQILDFEILYPTKKLESWLNTKINGLIIDKVIPQDNQRDSLRIIVERTQGIELHTKGDSVDVLFPLEVIIIANKNKRSGKVKKRKISGTLNLYLNIKPSIDKDWNIVSKTILKNHQWIKEPQLQLGHTHIGIKFITNHLLKDEINKVTMALDTILNEKVDLKKAINKTWINLQNPISIIESDSLNLFFKIDPKTVYGDIKINKDGFLFQLSVETRSLININKDSLTSVNELPSFKALKAFHPETNKLDVLASLPLSFINYSLNQIIKNYKYEKTLLNLQIENINLKGASDDIVIELDVKGSASGKVTLIGKPSYNPKTHLFSIKDLNYQLDTKNILVNRLDKSFKKDLLSYINKNVKINLGDYIEKLPIYLNQSINQGESADKFILTFEEVKINNLHYIINQTHLQILMNARPIFHIKLVDLPVKKKMLIK